MTEPTVNTAPDQNDTMNTKTTDAASMSPDELNAAIKGNFPEAQADNLQAELDKALAKAQENHELYLRALADVENMRRRAAEDVSKAHKFAIESFAEALVPVKDSLETALALENQTPETLKEGVQATLRLLSTAFEKGKVQEINPLGEKFDPHKQQAVAMVPGDSVTPPVASNHVVAVLQKGYLIADRVLRPALVSVAQ
jgi:molecular chaperone GrpE